VTALASSSSSSAAAGTLGFLVVAAMGVILVFLFRSMSKHLRKVSGNGRDVMAASTAVNDSPNDAGWGDAPAPEDRGDS